MGSRGHGSLVVVWRLRISWKVICWGHHDWIGLRRVRGTTHSRSGHHDGMSSSCSYSTLASGIGPGRTPPDSLGMLTVSPVDRCIKHVHVGSCRNHSHRVWDSNVGTPMRLRVGCGLEMLFLAYMVPCLIGALLGRLILIFRRSGRFQWRLNDSRVASWCL